ncbi:MAG: DUF192 domain-containing protein [Balneolaceae bacterium]|nr:DUF192 domain-containing protein [Balneolaceae bacterium]
MKLPLLSNSHRLLGILLSLLLLAACGKQEQADSGENEPKGRILEYTRQVSFLNQQGEVVETVGVAVADDNTERSTGLMDVNRLPPDKGMLFVFDDEQPRSFWMANTPLSLDIIFVNADLEIVRIHHNTQPFTENNFTSGAPSKYVVEVNGGFCVSNDIQEGMRIAIE